MNIGSIFLVSRFWESYRYAHAAHVRASCSFLTLAALAMVFQCFSVGAYADDAKLDEAMGNIPDASIIKSNMPRVARYRAFLPLTVDLSSKMPRPGNQRSLGSCTSWAVAYAARSYYTSVLESRPPTLASNIPSPLYVYQMSNHGKCGGTTFADAVDILKDGALSLKSYPYQASCSHPSPSQVAAATDFRIKGLWSIDETNADDIRGELAKGNPVLISLAVGRDWNWDKRTHGVRGGYLIEGNGIETKDQSSHAMTLIGYDDTRQAFRLINSWGQTWGDRGYAWMSYDFVRDHRVSETAVLEVQPSPQPTEPERTHVSDPPTPPPPVVVTAPLPVTRPSDIGAHSCSSIHRTDRADGVHLLGFVQTEADLQAIKVSAEAKGEHVDLKVFPFPLCEVALTLEKQLAEADGPKIDTNGKVDFDGGDTLSFKVQAPQSLRYVYILYFSHDGDVQVLAQPRGLVPSPTLPGMLLAFGDGKEGRQKFTVGPPFGNEMIVALTSKSPLFDQPLPAIQTERQFLSDLRRQLVYKPDPSLPDREVSASIAALVTTERR